MRKRLLPILLAGMLAASLCACSWTPAPERALDRMLGALQDGKLRTAERYTVSGSLGINRSGRSAERIYEPLFGALTYTITGSVTDGDSALVSVSIVTVDMEELMAQTSVQVLQNALASGRADPADAYYRQLLENLKDPSAPVTGFDVGVRLARAGGAWRVDMAASGDFADAICGGVSLL